jgi:hypothetical protein
MKTKTNIALEGTCNGDVVGGFYCDRGKPSGAFVLRGEKMWLFKNRIMKLLSI